MLKSYSQVVNGHWCNCVPTLSHTPQVAVYKRFWLRFANIPFDLSDLDNTQKHFTVNNYNDSGLLQVMMLNLPVFFPLFHFLLFISFSVLLNSLAAGFTSPLSCASTNFAHPTDVLPWFCHQVWQPVPRTSMGGGREADLHHDSTGWWQHWLRNIMYLCHRDRLSVLLWPKAEALYNFILPVFIHPIENM